MDWEEWYEYLKEIASNHRESVADESGWKENWELGESPEEAFYEEYPEHMSPDN